MPFLPAVALRSLLLAATLALAVVGATPALDAQTATASTAAIDHAPFDAMLRAHVTDGLVDYEAFARDPRFPAYLESLRRARLGGRSADERLAFWINVYNAYTIQLIVVKEERESIKNINRTLGLLRLKGPWSERLVRAAGRDLTLDEVEHEIIRKEFREPRIHFALVCAAIGCPPLRSEAFVAARLDAQLRDQGERFLRQSPAKNRVDVASGTVHVSPIFTWYKEDFGGSDAAVGRFIAGWYPPGPERALLESGRFRLRETDYDWRLNVRPGR